MRFRFASTSPPGDGAQPDGRGIRRWSMSSSPPYAVSLGVAGLVALGARIAWVEAVAGHYPLASDALFYRHGALALARGYGYGFAYLGRLTPTAQFPPAFVTYLASAAWLFGY